MGASFFEPERGQRSLRPLAERKNKKQLDKLSVAVTSSVVVSFIEKAHITPIQPGNLM